MSGSCADSAPGRALFGIGRRVRECSSAAQISMGPARLRSDDLAIISSEGMNPAAISTNNTDHERLELYPAVLTVAPAKPSDAMVAAGAVLG